MQGASVRWLVVGAVLPLLACSGQPDGAVLAVVRFEPGSAAACVTVQLRSLSGTVSSAKMNRKGRSQLKVGIKRTDGLTGRMQLQALGFSKEDCPDEAWSELSAVMEGNLDAPGLTQIELVLDGTGDVDADRDTFSKSVDCDDTNPAINPGQTEACSNLIDDNCDLIADCADPLCNAKACNDGNGCTATEVCSGGICASPQDACTTPGSCEKLPGSCANGGCQYPANIGAACPNGGACRSDRTCGSGEVDCANGLDDDNDGGADCFDPACAAQDCDAGTLLCHTRATCQANGCAVLESSAKTCTPPPGGCFTGGACQSDAGCVFTQLAAGALCPQGSCRTDGGCGPVEGVGSCANGQDDDGDGLTDCLDPGCTGELCEDNNSCTSSSVCTALACSGGTAVVCPPAPVCTAVDQCLSDGGCTFAPRPPGTACPGGSCSDAGACVLTSDGGFRFPPSNFDAGIPAAAIAGNIVFANNCVATFNGAWLDACGQAVPVPLSIAQAGGELAWLLPMRGLTIDASSSLRLQGSRPVILAVYGDVELQGSVSARSLGAGVAGSLGAGGNWAGCADAGMNGMNGGSRPGFGAGGGGAAFASDGGNGMGGMADGGIGPGGSGGLGRGDPLVPLHGGCRGGTGGGPVPSVPGAGGGAVQISAAGRLRVSSWISASGGAGQPGEISTGGGGAGSGGAIFLEADQLMLLPPSRLTCNGGGGGEGGGEQDPGGEGADGSPNTNVPAGGGAIFPRPDNINGGDGGNGAAGTIAAQPGLHDDNSGGGGGGGLGHIRIRAVTACTTSGGISGVLSRAGSCP